MSDIEDITQVISLVSHIVDNKEWDRLADVYSDDATFVLANGSEYAGLEKVHELMTTFTHPLGHFTTNIVVDVEPGGEHAHSVSKTLNPTVNNTFNVADYRDTLVRTPAGWRISRRQARITAVVPFTAEA